MGTNPDTKSREKVMRINEKINIRKKYPDLLKNCHNLFFKEIYKQVMKSVWRINIGGLKGLNNPFCSIVLLGNGI